MSTKEPLTGCHLSEDPRISTEGSGVQEEFFTLIFCRTAS